MVKMFHARRNPDVAQKKQMAESSKIVADIMLKHLSVEGHRESKNILNEVSGVKSDADDTASLFTYYSVILGLLALLLYDGTIIQRLEIFLMSTNVSQTAHHQAPYTQYNSQPFIARTDFLRYSMSVARSCQRLR
jgi:hypothetical protein